MILLCRQCSSVTDFDFHPRYSYHNERGTHMKSYRVVQTVSGVDLGIYAGETEDQALDAMARDQGYDDYDGLLSVTRETRDADTLKISEV